jgi:deoxyribose-phosphate aldolase
MMEAIRDHGSGGFKASGGVRTREDAEAYLAIADELLGPEWATPQTFRIGASSLLDALVA